LKNRYIVRSFSCLILIIMITLIGCSKERIEKLKKEKLFKVPSDVIFKNGFFFIVDTVNQKIMKITTTGDVILVIAKGEKVFPDKEEVLRTKQRKYFNFNKIGKITTDSENNIYVEDKILQKAPEKSEIDIFGVKSNNEVDEDGEIYVSYVLKFDRLGKFLYKIGKDGIESKPFYYLYKMDIDKNGRLVVLSVDDSWENWNYKKYDSDGNLIFDYTIDNEKIIGESDLENRSFFVLDAYPLYNNNCILFWISMYDTTNDTKKIKKEEDLWGEEIEIENLDENNKDDNINKENKRDLLFYKLLFYNYDSNKVDKIFRWEDRISNMVKTPEEFFGIDKNENSFFWKYENNSKAIISIIRPNGNIITRRSFVFDKDGIWININVSNDGSIFGIKVDDKFLNFYRWRSDKLVINKSEKLSLKEFIKEKIEEFTNANR